ncbi:MAG: alpha/beta fold hydrolase [Anaerolineaceae bacterium]|nr:alpha/beta fold hydrolase [Anaerolineaceae bacterium]
MKKQEGRSMTSFNIFKDHETDWTFKRTLAEMSEKGAETGECLWAAQQIDEKDINSWINTWNNLAARVEELGDESYDKGRLISARESYLRASNYFRTAEYACAPDHPLWQPSWKKSTAAFQKAARLFTPQIQYLEIPFENFRLPAYFWRPADDNINRPTLLAVGGNDSSGEEMVFACGFSAFRRGYNFFTFEYPGHRGAVHLDPACVKRPDFEVPFKAALDYLSTLPGVDERIALAGFSFGGFVINRVAIHEKRIKALIPDSPIINMHQMARRFFDRFPDWMPIWLRRNFLNLGLKRSPMKKALLDYSLYTWGIKGDLFDFLKSGISEPFNISDQLAEIKCPVLGLVSDAEGPLLLEQANKFIQGIGSKNKQLKILTLSKDGTDDHCQLDNFSRAGQLVFDWLDEVL